MSKGWCLHKIRKARKAIEIRGYAKLNQERRLNKIASVFLLAKAKPFLEDDHLRKILSVHHPPRNQPTKNCCFDKTFTRGRTHNLKTERQLLHELNTHVT